MQCSIAFINLFLPIDPNGLTRAAELGTSPRCTAWQRSGSKLRTGKAPEPGSDVRITASSSISCMVTSGPIMYPVMEDQFLSRCRTAQPPASEYEDAEPLTGTIGRHCGGCLYGGRTQIVLFGMTSGSHMTDQVAALIGGSACVLLDSLITQRDAGMGYGRSGQRRLPRPGELNRSRPGPIVTFPGPGRLTGAVRWMIQSRLPTSPAVRELVPRFGTWSRRPGRGPRRPPPAP
jgi:hypothetical protein